MYETYKKWLEDGQPKIYCGCPCHEEIIIKCWHEYDGIPKYIKGHNHRFRLISESYKDWLKDGCSKVYCECSCQEEIIIKSHCKWYGIPKYISGHNPCPEGYKIILSERWITNNNPNWKEGITPLNNVIRSLTKYFEWRLQIFGRDNFNCQSCDIRGVYLEVHHIKPFNEIVKEYNIKNIKDALNCEMLWNLDNGVTYCTKCHNKLKKKGGIL